MENQISIITLMYEASLVVKLVIILLVLGSVASWAIAFFKMREYSVIKKSNFDFLIKFREMRDIYEVDELSSLDSNSTLKPIFTSGNDEFYKFLRFFKKFENNF